MRRDGLDQHRKDKKGDTSGDWAIGTKVTGKAEEGKVRHVPKLKGRNPAQVIKQLASSEGIEASAINAEVTQMLAQFNTQLSNIAEFMAEVV